MTPAAGIIARMGRGKSKAIRALLVIAGIAVLAIAAGVIHTILRVDAKSDLAAEMGSLCGSLGETAQIEPIEGEWYAGCELWHPGTDEPDEERIRHVEQTLLANGWSLNHREDGDVVYERRTGLWDTRAHLASRSGEGFAFSFQFASDAG